MEARAAMGARATKANIPTQAPSPFQGATVARGTAVAEAEEPIQGTYPIEPYLMSNELNIDMKVTHTLVNTCKNQSELTTPLKALTEPTTTLEALTESQKLNIRIKAKKMLKDLGFKEIPPPTKHGGRIQYYLENWQTLTKDQWILDVIQGKPIEWLETPRQKTEPKELTFSSEMNAAVDVEIAKMLDMGVIQTCQECPDQFVSTLFMRPKKDGGWRPIINLKWVNQYLQYLHFKLEGMPDVIDQINKDDFQYKVDLSSAYWTVRLHPKDRKFMRFRWKGVLMEFLVWPFGLGPVPRWWTKLMKPAIALLRKMGAKNVIYMDDIWGGESDLEVSVLHTYLTVELLTLLGFVVNLPKSILDPTRILKEFLGFIVNSTELSLSLPEKRIKKITEACKNILSQEQVTVRDLSKVIGQLVAAARAVLPAPLHYRKMQMTQISSLLKNQRNYGAQMSLNEECREELKWWIENLSTWNGKSFIAASSPHTMQITTDASKKGWGRCANERRRRVGGR